MPASICVFILTFSTLCGSTVVSGALSGPTNVSLTSHNMNLVLRWDPPEGAAGGLVYTAEYKTKVTEYRVGCVNISALECDFTRLNIPISEFGTYTSRVRAQLGAETSAWVESSQITLDIDTIISPPSVSLMASEDSIEVIITDPVLAISSLRTVYSGVTYNLNYWKSSQEEKVSTIRNIQQNRLTLSSLDTRTEYCVQVQFNMGYSKPSMPSMPSKTVCHMTGNKEETPWVPAVVTFVVMAAAVALVAVMVAYRRSISHFLCPKDALPQHFKEYLPPNSSLYLAMRSSHPPEEIYHQVSIIADDRTVEERRPLEAAGTSCSKLPDVTAGER